LSLVSRTARAEAGRRRSRWTGRSATPGRSARPRTGPCWHRCRRSSARSAVELRPEEAAADFRISLARRSSRTSRSSDFSRSRSSLVSPGRRPSSVSARRTHLRNVSEETPNLCAMEQIAAHCEGCSSWCSNTMRTARSRSSWGYLPGLDMAPTSHQSEPPGIPGRFNGVAGTDCFPK
jgi:hypothetical protein